MSYLLSEHRIQSSKGHFCECTGQIQVLYAVTLEQIQVLYAGTLEQIQVLYAGTLEQIQVLYAGTKDPHYR